MNLFHYAEWKRLCKLHKPEHTSPDTFMLACIKSAEELGYPKSEPYTPLIKFIRETYDGT